MSRNTSFSDSRDKELVFGINRLVNRDFNINEMDEERFIGTTEMNKINEELEELDKKIQDVQQIFELDAANVQNDQDDAINSMIVGNVDEELIEPIVNDCNNNNNEEQEQENIQNIFQSEYPTWEDKEPAEEQEKYDDFENNKDVAEIANNYDEPVSETEQQIIDDLERENLIKTITFLLEQIESVYGQNCPTIENEFKTYSIRNLRFLQDHLKQYLERGKYGQIVFDAATAGFAMIESVFDGTTEIFGHNPDIRGFGNLYMEHMRCYNDEISQEVNKAFDSLGITGYKKKSLELGIALAKKIIINGSTHEKHADNMQEIFDKSKEQ